MKKKDLFDSTAAYYSRYRRGYPSELLEALVSRLESKNRLLDIGCGTGQLAGPLSLYFDETIGIDINIEMIEEAQACYPTGIQFMCMASEAIDHLQGSFDMIVCGNAFHWMDRKVVLEKAYGLLKDDGIMVILAGGSLWTGQADWQKKVKKVIQSWLGEKRRAGQGHYPDRHRPHEDLIHESPFVIVAQADHHMEHVWSVESLIGYLYSTSFCNKKLLGDNISDFENDLKKALLEMDDSGAYVEQMAITYFILKKR